MALGSCFLQEGFNKRQKRSTPDTSVAFGASLAACMYDNIGALSGTFLSKASMAAMSLGTMGKSILDGVRAAKALVGDL
jgi:hypothetical protein